MDTKHKHFKIYKPYRMLSQFSSNAAKEQKKRFLGELGDFPGGIMPIGRLDEKSEGLLLLTTDGKLSDHVNQSGIEKEYYALVDGDISAKAIQQLSEGVEIGFNGKKYITKPCKVTKLKELPDLPERSKKIRDARHGPTSWVSITITEGKFRQVRKMTSAVNCPTLRLVRVRVGNITLDNMNVADVLAIKNLNQLL
ncbi:pseudouridine synthase [Olleya sp. UBA1516]|uniref:pseudouridine synthase n=1 Tax=Olleya sp. UBA1516 TaxID=1947013 RepID=UPI0025DB3C65|nr:pseudouridine synthase [Olleya sp. UBA1516]|tara:strand:+ start:127542 stop:128129 length:588 start_codon:yes stop_codon:yes gene_type:complete